jgi:hypothetical protein
VAAQVGEAAGGDGAAPTDDADPVREGFDLAEDVAGQQHGDAIPAPFAYALLECLFHQRVEPRGRLVEDEQVRLRGQRGDEGDLLAILPSTEHDERGRHEPVIGGLLQLIERGRRRREFDCAMPTAWYFAAIIGLGHAAGQEVTAGRMTPAEAASCNARSNRGAASAVGGSPCSAS